MLSLFWNCCICVAVYEHIFNVLFSSLPKCINVAEFCKLEHTERNESKNLPISICGCLVFAAFDEARIATSYHNP